MGGAVGGWGWVAAGWWWPGPGVAAAWRGWPKRYGFGMGWWGRGRGGLPLTPIFAIRKTMTIAYIKVLVTG
jgi:hypothetical protein